jgi:hypothetical protein
MMADQPLTDEEIALIAANPPLLIQEDGSFTVPAAPEIERRLLATIAAQRERIQTLEEAARELLVGEAPDEMLNEGAYLVARGVRPLALMQDGTMDNGAMLRAMTRLGMHGEPPAIPFVLDHHDGTGSYGYAAASWVIDLYRWARLQAPDTVRAQVIGLLLGYSPEAVSRYMEAKSGELFTVSLEPASS